MTKYIYFRHETKKKAALVLSFDGGGQGGVVLNKKNFAGILKFGPHLRLFPTLGVNIPSIHPSNVFPLFDMKCRSGKRIEFVSGLLEVEEIDVAGIRKPGFDIDCDRLGDTPDRPKIGMDGQQPKKCVRVGEPLPKI